MKKWTLMMMVTGMETRIIDPRVEGVKGGEIVHEIK